MDIPMPMSVWDEGHTPKRCWYSHLTQSHSRSNSVDAQRPALLAQLDGKMYRVYLHLNLPFLWSLTSEADMRWGSNAMPPHHLFLTPPFFSYNKLATTASIAHGCGAFTVLPHLLEGVAFSGLAARYMWAKLCCGRKASQLQHVNTRLLTIAV